MRLDSAHSHKKLLCDLLAAVARGDQEKNFFFTHRKLIAITQFVRSDPPQRFCQRVKTSCAKMALARYDTIYGGDELRTATALLQKTISSSAHRIKDFALVRGSA